MDVDEETDDDLDIDEQSSAPPPPPPSPPPTTSEMQRMMDRQRKYLLLNGLNTVSLDDMERVIQMNALEKMQQPRITAYFGHH